MEIHGTNTTGEWLSGSGPESDIVISSRIRLARNLKDYPFIPKLDLKGRAKMESHIKAALDTIELPVKLDYLDLGPLERVDLDYLVERHLISRDLANADGPRAVAVGEHEALSIMVNEEDHLRLQMLGSGFELDNLWDRLNDIDDRLDHALPFCFHPQYGYLTSCPTNVGSGMRVSVMLHLPGLTLTNQIEKVFYAVSKISLAVRGLYGEGSQATSDFYQISNQITLGKSEEEIIENLKSVVPQIILYERNARQKLFLDDRLALEDKVHRAHGLLSSARRLSQDEGLDHLSTLRLGVNLGLFTKGEVDIPTINELFILSLPAHLQKKAERPLDSDEQQVVRADLVRSRLGG